MLGQPGDRRGQVLAVVEDQQRAPVAQVLDDERERTRRATGVEPAARHADRRRDGRRRARRVVDRRQVDAPDAARERGEQAQGHLRGQAGLADAAGAGERHEPVVGEPLAHRLELGDAVDEARQPLTEVGGRRGARRRRGELGVLDEHAALELAQLRRRLEAHVVEPADEGAVGREGVGLAPGAVEREQLQRGEALVERLGVDRAVELGQRVAVATQLDQRAQPSLDRRQAQLLEAPDLGLQRVEVGHVGVRAPAHERQGAPVGLGRLGGRERGGLADEALEALRVELARLDGEAVTGPVARDPRGAAAEVGA